MAAAYSWVGGKLATQNDFNASADAMSTAYGASIELYSIDPATGAEVVLADTSVTNLLAELPVLETQANGVTLGLQLADGAPQVQFASTAGLATFLYAVAVQQGQATSFVTDNYNLDMQWLNTVDQPLLQEAVFWTERAQDETAAGQTERAIEDTTQASMALQIAAEAPGARQDMSVTINNAATGNPTQITVYADGDGSTIHDVASNVFGQVLGAISTVVSVAALVTGNAYLYFAAAAVDTANAGEDFSNGQDVSAILSTAAAISAGITGGAGGTPGATPPPVSVQIINAAVQGVGGIYGVVQSAETGNGAGIFAGALEAAAAAASGIGLYESGQTQAMLNSVATALGTIGLATNVGSAFASGNIALGLEDSLNLYLPAVAQAYSTYQTVAQTDLAPNNLDASATVTPVPAGGLASLGSSNVSGGTDAVVTEGGEPYVFTVQSESATASGTVTLDTIANALWNWTLKSTTFLTSEAQQILDATVPASTSARNMSMEQVQFVDNDGNLVRDQHGNPMMMPANANPAAVSDIGSALASLGDWEGVNAGAIVGIANLALFRQGGAWDFQRIGPSQTPVAAPIAAFTDFANFEIGAYAASIGMSLNEVLEISNQYAAQNSSFNFTPSDPQNAIYTNLRNANVWDITLGYSKYQDGSIGHH